MNRILFVFALFFSVAISAQPIEPQRQNRQPLTRPEPERAAKAQELLTQTRAALSQTAKLDDVKTLSASGKLRRLTFTAGMGGNSYASVSGIGIDMDPTVLGAQGQMEHFIEGKVQYEFSLPEKFWWEEKIERMQRSGFFDGERFATATNGQLKMLPPDPRLTAMVQQQTLTTFAHIPLGLLLNPPPAFPVEYSDLGEKPFRQTTADVVAITGPGTFKADLYLDQKTHLPLLLRMVIGGIPRPAMVFTPHGTSRAEAMRQLEIAKQQANAKPPGQQEREKLILFEDYRAVDGVLFPHKITTQINGKLIEELTFTKFKVNQPIKPEKFTEKQ